MSWTPDSGKDLSKKHGESLIKDVIWWNNPKKIPSIFVWLDKEALLKALMRVYNSEGIEEVLKWKDVISEWDKDCTNFYLFLKWKLWIYKGNKFVTNVDKLSVVWEMWFLWANRRTASVRAIETSYLLPLNRSFTNMLPHKDRAELMENIGKELARKLYITTTSSCETWCIDSDIQDLAWVQWNIQQTVDKLLI